MTREEKHEKKKARAAYRRKIRMAKYVEKIKLAEGLPHGVSLSGSRYGSWADPNSPTGYSQVCCYEAAGICQSPCNGDC